MPSTLCAGENVPRTLTHIVASDNICPATKYAAKCARVRVMRVYQVKTKQNRERGTAVRRGEGRGEGGCDMLFL